MMSWKQWLPSYLWYSGILMQAFLVILGVHTLISSFDRHPAHTLHNKLLQSLSDPEFCESTLANRDFGWIEPQEVRADVTSSKAAINSLTYRNLGSVGRTTSGDHVYRIQFEVSVKDLEKNGVVHFPPRFERLIEVDKNNRITRCHPDLNVDNLISERLQVDQRASCEKAGWSRLMKCDSGSERCYPVTQCARGG